MTDREAHRRRSTGGFALGGAIAGGALGLSFGPGGALAGAFIGAIAGGDVEATLRRRVTGGDPPRAE